MSAMTLAIKPLHPLFAAKLPGVDLAGNVDLAMQQAIEQAMDRYAVCVLPDQTSTTRGRLAPRRGQGVARRADGVRHAAALRLRAQMAGRRSHRLGQSLHDAPHRTTIIDTRGDLAAGLH